MSKWIVDIKGEAGDSFEISVLRTDNEIGQRSWGWFDENKILISGSGGPCHDTVPQMVWDKLVRVANEVAAELNHGIVPRPKL